MKTLPDQRVDSLQFEVAAGTIPGRNHVGSGNLLVGKNNQDALFVRRHGDALIAVVADGCGSCQRSEIGADLGARIAANSIVAILNRCHQSALLCAPFWQQVAAEILQRMQEIISSVWADEPTAERKCGTGIGLFFSAEVADFVSSHFLFTLLGAVIGPTYTVIFSIGDGVIVRNDRVTKLGPFPENAPPYIGYGLLSGAKVQQFCTRTYLTSSIDTLILGSDGVVDLIAHETEHLPGKNRVVGPLSAIFVNDDLFSPPGATQSNSLTSWLRLMNSEVVRQQGTQQDQVRLVRFAGLLPDDTTLVALRRSKSHA